MRLLLISTRAGNAGVETLLLRMVQYFFNNNIVADVLLMREGDHKAANELRKYCNLYIGKKFLEIKKNFKNKGFDYYNYIYTFSLFPLIYSLYIQKKIFSKAKLCFGTYHPLEYCWEGNQPKSFLAKLSLTILKKIPAENIFFMNEGIRLRHKEKTKINFQKSTIFPIPIDLEKYQNIQRKPKKNKIVSIGRIVDFKTYNFTMVDAIEQLKQKGYPLEYHIYGHGEQYYQLKNYIHSKNLTNQVFLHGEFPYTEFADKLIDAFLFVGVGTALVEAAACGVPCLQAIEADQKGETYGFFHQLQGFNLGEIEPFKPQFLYTDIILEFLEITEQEYDLTCQLSKERAKQFESSAILLTFIENLKNTQSNNLFNSVKIHFGLIYIVSYFILNKVGLCHPNKNRYLQQ